MPARRSQLAATLPIYRLKAFKRSSFKKELLAPENKVPIGMGILPMPHATHFLVATKGFGLGSVTAHCAKWQMLSVVFTCLWEGQVR